VPPRESTESGFFTALRAGQQGGARGCQAVGGSASCNGSAEMCMNPASCALHATTRGAGTTAAPECSTCEAGHWSTLWPGSWACRYGAPTITKKARMPNSAMLRMQQGLVRNAKMVGCSPIVLLADISLVP